MTTSSASIEKLYATIGELRSLGVAEEKLFGVLDRLELWDESTIAVALGAPREAPREEHGVPSEAPRGIAETPATATFKEVARTESIGPLAATFHHISLWFFMGATIPAIVVLTPALLQQGRGGPQELAGFIATAIVTALVYGGFYGFYLRRALSSPATVIPHKVFSIITLAFALILTMGALITFLVTLLSSDWHGDARGQLLSSALLIVVGLAFLGTYLGAALLKQGHRLRKPLLIGAPAVVAAVLVSLLAASFASFPSALRDAQLAEDISTAAQAIRTQTDETGALPSVPSFEKLSPSPAITYAPTGSSTYKLCAPFERETEADYGGMGYTEAYPGDDAYLSAYTFELHSAGEHCFYFENAELATQQERDGFAFSQELPWAQEN
jgi:hypothetical protein